MRVNQIVSVSGEWIDRIFNGKRPTMNRKLAHEIGERKLKEVISRGRTQIMALIDTYEHEYLGKDGEEYIFGDGQGEGKEWKQTYLKRNGKKQTTVHRTLLTQRHL